MPDTGQEILLLEMLRRVVVLQLHLTIQKLCWVRREKKVWEYRIRVKVAQGSGLACLSPEMRVRRKML